jgi:molecular chaperone DnaK (HSP70)
MMREAGYKAGLCSRKHCPALQVASHNIPNCVEDNQPDKLSLALEPESAAIFCQNMSQKQHASYCQVGAPFTATSYLIVDIGGGTVDISAHQIMRDPEPHIRVIHPPTGNSCGGSMVNKEFEKFLQDMVRDKGFHRFVSGHSEIVNAKNRVYMNELLNENFEKQKKIFADKGGGTTSRKLSIELPAQFYKTYMHDLMEGVAEKGESLVKLVGQDLRLSHELMDSFFQPVKEGIIECINDILVDVNKIETIYLVGGFGGSRYISRTIQEEFRSRSFTCIVPVEPAYAIVKGAVLYKQNPSLVKSRKVDATYGLSITCAFQDSLHDRKYQWTNDDGRLMCDSIFSTVVERGDVVGSGDAFLNTFSPGQHNQTSMTITFYSSQEKDIFYVTGEWGKGSRKQKATVQQIGEVEISMPDTTGDKSRAVDVTFDFSHTEIQVKAFDRTSRNEVKTVLNFLTSIK